jgi:two-component system NtrC family sensor kinase
MSICAEKTQQAPARVTQTSSSDTPASDARANGGFSWAQHFRLSEAATLQAVDRLAAGIAHELNTRMQYMGDNLTFLQRALYELSTVIARGMEHQECGRARDKLLFLYRSIPEAIDSAIDGCRNMAEVVRAVQAFADPGNHDPANVDINDALAATLLLARGSIQTARIHLDLGELPPVMCRIAQLNQVFLTLFMNAADAISERQASIPDRGTISISTRLREDRIVVEVSDDGRGIPAAIQARVFEPGYTTKRADGGVNHGLAFARAVVGRHGGALHFRTTPGIGTTFVVEIPLYVSETLGVATPPPGEG